jgi:hypothetical protein
MLAEMPFLQTWVHQDNSFKVHSWPLTVTELGVRAALSSYVTVAPSDAVLPLKAASAL